MNLLSQVRRLKMLQAQAPRLSEMIGQAKHLRRRVLVIVAAVAVCLSVFLVVALVPVVTAPVAAPVAVAGKVLGGVAGLFGTAFGDNSLTGKEIEDAGRGSGIDCKPQDVPTPTSRPAVDTPDASTAELSPDSGDDAASPAAPDAATPKASPIAVRTDGSLSRDDARRLIDPVPIKTSALTAHVWFLYRLAGIGDDWGGFVTAYRDAGLHGDDEAEDAPLLQVQRLNHDGVPVDGYRLTAASLAASGLYTGRFSEPYPGYRQLLATELLSGCMAKTGLEERRMKLPPAAVTSPAPVPDAADLPASAASPEPVSEEEPPP